MQAGWAAKRLPGQGQPAPAQRFRSPASLEDEHTHPTVPAETRCEQDLPTPTTPPQPSPTPAPSSPVVFRYNVSGSNGTCLLASMGLQLNVTYRTVDNKVGRPEPCSLCWVLGRLWVVCPAGLGWTPIHPGRCPEAAEPGAAISSGQACQPGEAAGSPSVHQVLRGLGSSSEMTISLRPRVWGGVERRRPAPPAGMRAGEGCRKYQQPSASSGFPLCGLVSFLLVCSVNRP